MIPSDIQNFLNLHELKALEFDEGSTPTAKAAADKIGVSVGQIAKSILVKGKNGNFYLIVCAGDKRIDTKKTKALTGTKTRMATAEELFDITGFKPGEVCPFRKLEISTFLDSSLKEYTTIYPAAGTDSSGVPISFEKLIEITGASECSVTD
ncbi:MAG: YbaK/EbsC family protein [Spirochaetales bacterium]|nr:YbaK/EbsC family protein [Spirochaetales bacterium]